MLNFGLFLEYALLGFLFWYVYLRKKPIYRVRGDSWGNYSELRDTFKDERNDQSQQLPVHRNENLIAPIRIKQSRRNGWIFAENEKQVLHDIKNVNLEITSANPKQF